MLEFCIYVHVRTQVFYVVVAACVISTHLAQPSNTTAISVTTTTTTSFASSTAITSCSTTHLPCCLAPPPRAHWQPQHGCVRESPAPPTAQSSCPHSLLHPYCSYNHPHRMCLYSLATSCSMVSRNDLRMLIGCMLLLLCVFSFHTWKTASVYREDGV